jgi:hypothetical protein
MTPLLEDAIYLLKELPDEMQDRLAAAIICQLNEEPEPLEPTSGHCV